MGWGVYGVTMGWGVCEVGGAVGSLWDVGVYEVSYGMGGSVGSLWGGGVCGVSYGVEGYGMGGLRGGGRCGISYRAGEIYGAGVWSDLWGRVGRGVRVWGHLWGGGVGSPMG